MKAIFIIVTLAIFITGCSSKRKYRILATQKTIYYVHSKVIINEYDNGFKAGDTVRYDYKYDGYVPESYTEVILSGL